MQTLKAAFIGLVLAVVLFPLAAGAAEPGAKVPDLWVKTADYIYRGFGAPPDHAAAENVLRSFALTTPDPAVDRNLAWVRRSNWAAGFKTMFDRAVRWARATRQLGPDKLYQMSREFFAQPNAGKRFFGAVASSLRGLAADRGHEQAQKERNEWARNRKRVWTKLQHELLIELVGKGDATAMYLLAERYEKAQGLERDLAKSYYWYLRSAAVEWNGKQAKSGSLALRRLERELSPEDRRHAFKWFETGIEPSL